MADFALFGESIVRSLNSKDANQIAQDWHKILDKIQLDQQEFSLEEDILPWLINIQSAVTLSRSEVH